jgi:hypothetical protein
MSVVGFDVLNISPVGWIAVLEPKDNAGRIAGESLLVEAFRRS